MNVYDPNRVKKLNSDRKTVAKNNNQTLAQFAGWDVKTVTALENYALSLKTIPSTRALITSMIKFDRMYQDIHKNIFSTNFWTDFDGLNEYRKAQRAKIQLHKKDLLKSEDGVNGKTLVLTTRAHKIFYQKYPLAALRKQKWNGVWTVVMYDLPETRRSSRDYLRRKLKNLGFGALQQSIFVSPLSLEEAVQELIEGEKLKDCVVVLTAKRVLGLTNEQIASTAWNLKELGALYTKLLDILPQLKKSRHKKLLTEWRTYFLAVNFEDPYLPFELLPDDWPGEKCKKEFQKLGLPGLLKVIFGL